MLDHTKHRMIVLVMAACASLGATAVLAVHAGARGHGLSVAPTPSGHPRPNPPPGLSRTASAQQAPQVMATNAQCGQHVTASLTLNGDLTCTSGTALIVTGSNIVLNVNGHQVSGSGPTTGIEVDGTSDTVENGLVSGFAAGIYVAGTSDTLLNVRAVSNSYGIEDVGTATKITNSVVSRSTNYGIFTGGSGGVYSGDHELSNGNDGVILISSHAITITGNVANGNGTGGSQGSGIDDFGFGTTLTKNTADFNGQDGIYVTDISALDGTGNTAKGNDYIAGNAPEQCRGVVCG